MPIRSASSTSSSWRRNISVCVEFLRGVVVDQIASRISHPPGSDDGLPRAAASWFYRPLRGGFRQALPVLFVRSSCYVRVWSQTICPVSGRFPNRGSEMRPEVRMARYIEGLERYRSGRLSCEEAAELLEVSERHFRL